MEGISEHPLQILHRRLARIDRQRLAAAQIAKAPAVVQAHDMIGMGVREQHRVQPANLLAQHLDAEFRRRVDDHLGLLRRHIDRWPRAVVLRVGQKRGRIFHANDRHALRSA